MFPDLRLGVNGLGVSPSKLGSRQVSTLDYKKDLEESIMTQLRRSDPYGPSRPISDEDIARESRVLYVKLVSDARRDLRASFLDLVKRRPVSFSSRFSLDCRDDILNLFISSVLRMDVMGSENAWSGKLLGLLRNEVSHFSDLFPQFSEIF